MKCYFFLFVCLQSNMVAKGQSVEINNHTPLSPSDGYETASTDSQQLVTETSTEFVTEVSTTDLTTDRQSSTDDITSYTTPTDITDTTDITDSPNTTGLLTTEEGNERSTLLRDDQTVHPDMITTTSDEEEVTGSGMTGSIGTSQNFENTESTFIEQVSSTENTPRNISSLISFEPNETVSIAIDQNTRRLEATLSVDFGVENSSRIPEETTPAIEESEITSTASNKIKILCKTVEDCAYGKLCVSILNSCVCVDEWTTKESNFTQCKTEPTQPRSNATVISEENDENVINVRLAYRKLVNLSPVEQTESVATLAFTPSVELVEWFQAYDAKFKAFLASRLSIAWKKLNNDTVRFPDVRNSILYVTPSPLLNEDSIIVSFLVQSPFSDYSEGFLHAEEVLDSIRVEWNDLETQLQLNVTYMKIGFPFEALQACSTKVLGDLEEKEVKLLFLGMLTLSTCSLLAAIVAITVQCRAKRSRFIDLSALRRLPYGHPAAVLVRSPGDGTISGRDLATDQQCKEEEFDRERWMASHSQRGNECNDERAEKTVMVEIQGPKKDISSETPF